MIKIGVVDDHAAVIYGVTAILANVPDIRVQIAASTALSLVEAAPEIDLVLLDLSLSDGSTVASNVSVLSGNGWPVLAFTAGEQADLVREAIRAGVSGMIRKSASVPDLVSAIRTVASGDQFFDPEWAETVEQDHEFVSGLLTPREIEVLSLYASGESASSVARLLFISEDTVNDHVRRIRRKYSDHGRPVRSRVDLFKRAVEDGIVTFDE